MLFTQAYAHPACSPSRAALMTGKHPARLGITTALGLNRQYENSPVITSKVADFRPTEEITLAGLLINKFRELIKKAALKDNITFRVYMPEVISKITLIMIF